MSAYAPAQPSKTDLPNHVSEPANGFKLTASENALLCLYFRLDSWQASAKALGVSMAACCRVRISPDLHAADMPMSCGRRTAPAKIPGGPRSEQEQQVLAWLSSLGFDPVGIASILLDPLQTGHLLLHVAGASTLALVI